MSTNTYAMNGNGRSFSAGGPGQSVNPINAAFAGGTYAPARTPTDVGGAFSTPSAAGGPPPSFGTPSPAFARNDRGSNIRVPYARVVPMHNKDALFVSDDAITGTGRSWAHEYDGLQSGELAWIMSKQFSKLWAASSDGAGGETPITNPDMIVASPLDFSSFAQNMDRLSDGVYRAGMSNNSVPPEAMALRNTDGTTRGLGDGALLGRGNATGFSFGPDRMQRLAYTKWIEALFIQRIGRQVIDLARVCIADADGTQERLDSEIDFYAKQLRVGPVYPNNPASGFGAVKNASLFAVPDVAYALQMTKPGYPLQVPVPQLQGLFVMEQGPFLRSYGVDHEPVVIVAEGINGRGSSAYAPGLATADDPDKYGPGRPLKIEVDRHLGSELAQRALVAELKKIGLFNWTPDGICLSKYATGPDGMADAEFDSRSGQLFNVGVQGPCISTSWVGDKDMVCLPMDKVFMLVVGRLSYELQDVLKKSNKTAGKSDDETDVSTQDDAVGKAALEWVDAAANLTKHMSRAYFAPMFVDPTDKTAPPTATAEGYAAASKDDDQAMKDRWALYVDELGAHSYHSSTTALLLAREEAYTTQVAFDQARSGAGDTWNTVTSQRFAEAREIIRGIEVMQPGNDARREAQLLNAQVLLDQVKEAVQGDRRQAVHSADFKATAQRLRAGDGMAVKRAELTDFRIMRATSSFLANNSLTKGPIEDPLGWKSSRCRLGIGYHHDKRSGDAEYILGGWCIGTVLDSAASRATIHAGQVRTAPSSMAINVNVNVEWWSPDKLYQHYQDVDRGIYTGAGGTQKPEGTVLMRTQPSYRTVEQVMAESGLDYADAEERLRVGEGDTEGTYKRPNVYGVNTDPIRRGAPDRTGADALGVGIGDPRVWEAVQPAGQLPGTNGFAANVVVGGITEAYAAYQNTLR